MDTSSVALEQVAGQAAANRRRSGRLCLEAAELIETARALRSTSRVIRRTIQVPSIRGGAEGCGPARPLPETRQRQCPMCGRDAINPANHLYAAEGTVKEEFRCSSCGAAFWIVQTAGAAFWIGSPTPDQPSG